MLTVVCVYKKEPDGPYSPKDVHRLAHGVKQNLSLPYKFLVMSDDVNVFDCEHVDSFTSLPYTWRGWWSKLSVFKLQGPVLYLDLDTVIVGSLDELGYAVQDTKKLMMLRGFYRGDRCSGILGWSETVNTNWILKLFIKQLAVPLVYKQHRTGALSLKLDGKMFRGDQEWLDSILREDQTVFIQDVVPGICSYKVHVLENGLPDDACVVCFHGVPKPSDVTHEPWMVS